MTERAVIISNPHVTRNALGFVGSFPASSPTAEKLTSAARDYEALSAHDDAHPDTPPRRLRSTNRPSRNDRLEHDIQVARMEV